MMTLYNHFTEVHPRADGTNLTTTYYYLCSIPPSLFISVITSFSALALHSREIVLARPEGIICIVNVLIK